MITTSRRARRFAVPLLAALATAVAATIAAAPVGAVGPHTPRGHTDRIQVRGGVAHVSGWVVDPDTAGSIRVRLRIDGRHTQFVQADRYRSDITQPRGWRAAITIPQGTHRLCARAMNRGAGHSRTLRCWTVTANYRPPAAPTRVRSSVTWNSVTVTWRPPTRHGGGVLHTYRVTAVDAAGHSTSVRAPKTAHTATITGLRPSHRYTIQVRARNAEQHSAPGLTSAVTAYPPIPAQRTPAPIAHSHYLRRLTGDPAHDAAMMRAMGAADAAANPRRHRYLSLLDIGAQTKGGVYLSATITYVTYQQLVAAIEAYLGGYASAQQYNAPVLVAVGTNNDGTVSRTQGRIWAEQVVAPLARWARSHTRRISVAGANDIEPGFSASRHATRAWLAGYLAAGHAKFVFNGSADGCPTVAARSTCNNGWTTYDLHWLAGGASPSRIVALPQIYNTAMPWQWQVISSVHRQPLTFGGPLTEHRACAQAGTCSSVLNSRAWHLLYTALRSDRLTWVHALPYGPDLRIS